MGSSNLSWGIPSGYHELTFLPIVMYGNGHQEDLGGIPMTP